MHSLYWATNKEKKKIKTERTTKTKEKVGDTPVYTDTGTDTTHINWSPSSVFYNLLFLFGDRVKGQKGKNNFFIFIKDILDPWYKNSEVDSNLSSN